MNKITFENYFHGTKATFKGCKEPRHAPYYISYNGIGSRYWLGIDKKGEYVIRLSNHWSAMSNNQNEHLNIHSDIAGNLWRLSTNNEVHNKRLAGKVYLKDMQVI